MYQGFLCGLWKLSLHSGIVLIEICFASSLQWSYEGSLQSKPFASSLEGPAVKYKGKIEK